MVLLIVTSTKVYKKPTLYFKIHTLSFLLLAEIVNFIGIFLIPYDNTCQIIAVITHVLFVFVFCWILMLSLFHLSTFLLPKKEDLLNKYSLTIFFTGYGMYLHIYLIYYTLLFRFSRFSALSRGCVNSRIRILCIWYSRAS